MAVHFLVKKKKSQESCNDKVCTTSADCADCGGGNATCYNGKCCEPKSCLTGNCGDTDGCGNACVTCKTGEVCNNGNCCACQDCDGKYCGPCTSCGGAPCPCPTGHKCVDGKCCEEKECTNDICGDAGCGKQCGCGPYGHCSDGKCDYGDICGSTANPNQRDYMKNQWGQFCKPSIDDARPMCDHCTLTNAQWEGNALAPIAGTITCKQCIDDKGRWNIHPTPVVINPDVGFYENVDGQIVAGHTGTSQNYCSELGCEQCICIGDDDCKRFGCTTCGPDRTCI